MNTSSSCPGALARAAQSHNLTNVLLFQRLHIRDSSLDFISAQFACESRHLSLPLANDGEQRCIGLSGCTAGVFNGLTPMAGMALQPSAPWQAAHLALKIAAPSAANRGIAMVATIANAKNLFIDSPVHFSNPESGAGSDTLLPLLQDILVFASTAHGGQ